MGAYLATEKLAELAIGACGISDMQYWLKADVVISVARILFPRRALLVFLSAEIRSHK